MKAKRMTIRQFIIKCKKLRSLGWTVRINRGEIRLRHSKYKYDHCPLTAVYRMEGGKYYKLDDACKAGIKLGLTEQDASTIIWAADCPLGERPTRRKLLEAFRLMPTKSNRRTPPRPYIPIE